MADIKQTIIEKAKELARLDQECVEYDYETTIPRNRDEFRDYFRVLIRLCAPAFTLKNEIQLLLRELESVFFETLKRRDYLTPNQSKVIKIDLAKEDRLFRMIKDAYKMKIIDYGTNEDAFFVKNKSNTMVLHAKDEKYEITENIAFEVIRKTVHVVERLYEQ